jgi:hypothetical protein
MHAAFLLNKLEPPSIAIVRVLLTSPRENAIQLKDSSGRLPLHVAAERHDVVLRLLVDSYKDGCYRKDANGDNNNKTSIISFKTSAVDEALPSPPTDAKW